MRFRWAAIAGALAVSSLLPAMAQPDENLPDARQILDRYVEVTGGKAAYEKIRTRVSTGTIEFKSAGVKGPLVVYQAAPDKRYQVGELPGVGQVEEGAKGDLAWGRDPINGPRVKEGDERLESLRDAVFNPEIHWQKQYSEVKTVAREPVGERECFKVMLQPRQGGVPETRWYDVESGLLLKVLGRYTTEMGAIDVELRLDDYRDIAGVRVPHRLTQIVLTFEQTVQYDKIEHNVEIPDDRFEPPADVKAIRRG